MRFRERKRLTAAEMLAGSVRVVLGDEISTGLDSATTHGQHCIGYPLSLP